MSGTIKNYSGVTVTVGGLTRPGFGSLTEPIGEATIDADYALIDRLTVPAAGYITVWEAAYSNLLFEQVGFRLIGEGTLQVSWRLDRPTSETNYTATGAIKRWHHKNWPCKEAPFWLCDQTALGHGTAATETGDTSGVPTLWGTGLGTAETFIVDKLMVRNPGDDDVVIERLIAQ